MNSEEEVVIDDSIKNLPFDPLKVMTLLIFLVVLTYVLIPNDPFFSYRHRDILYLPLSSTNGLRLMLVPMLLGLLIYFALRWTLDEIRISLWVACSFVFIAFPVVPLWGYYGWGESLYLEEMFVRGLDSTWCPVVQGIGLVILIIVKREAEFVEKGIETSSMKADVFALSFGGAIISWYSVVQVARPAGALFYPTPFTALMLVTGMMVCVFMVVSQIIRWSKSYWSKAIDSDCGEIYQPQK